MIKKPRRTLSEENIIKWLYIQKQNEFLIMANLKMYMRFYSSFPFINFQLNEITGISLLGTLLLLDRNKFNNFMGSKNFNYLFLLFISLATDYTPHTLNKLENSPDNNKNLEGTLISLEKKIFKTTIIFNLDNYQHSEINFYHFFNGYQIS